MPTIVDVSFIHTYIYLLILANFYLVISTIGSKRSSGVFRPACRLARDVIHVGFIAGLQTVMNLRAESPVLYHQYGPNGRTESMVAVILPRHLVNGRAPDQSVRDYIRSIGRPGDQAGHILAARYMGDWRNFHNFFPQNAHINMGRGRVIEAMVAFIVNRDLYARYSVNLLFENAEARRPYQIIYTIQARNGTVLFQDISIPNP